MERRKRSHLCGTLCRQRRSREQDSYPVRIPTGFRVVACTAPLFCLVRVIQKDT